MGLGGRFDLIFFRRYTQYQHSSHKEAIISTTTPSTLDENQHRRPVLIGEVLFDHLPDRKVLGGATFNVAWNLKGIGLDPLLLTAVGDDDEGQHVLSTMDRWGLGQEAIEVVKNRPTGRVEVTFNDGEPSYSIENDQAYDFYQYRKINANARSAIEDAALVYHGSLCWRGPITREAIVALRNATSAPRFVDLNIRRPWFDQAWLNDLIGKVDWLKLNVDELQLITGSSLSSDFTGQEIADLASELQQKFEVGNLFVTADKRGAFGIDADGNHCFAEAPDVDSFVDSVGAGDAFSAMAIACLIDGHPQEQALNEAVRFAAKACQIQGATTESREHYDVASIAYRS